MPGAKCRPYNDDGCRCGEFCIACIWSTPKNPGNHARAIRRVVDNGTFNKLMHDCMQRKSRG
ncbi:hypothetical protein D3C87_505800 [compost metagenome]